jgi:hypothetical protein
MSLSMRNSTASGNSANGITVLSTAATAVAALDDVAATSNGTGVVADGAATRVLITRLTAVANNVGISTTSGDKICADNQNHLNGVPTATQVPNNCLLGAAGFGSGTTAVRGRGGRRRK